MQRVKLNPLQIGANMKNPAGRINDKDPKLLELVDSVRANGILQPICVERLPEGEIPPYRVVFGSRRHRASILANLHEIEPVLLPEGADPDVYRIVENMERLDLSPLEEAEQLADLRESTKCSIGELAQMLSVTPEDVRVSLAINNLSPKWKGAYKPGTDAAGIDPRRMALIARYPHQAQDVLFELVRPDDFTKGSRRFDVVELMAYSLKDLGILMDGYVTKKLPPSWGMDFEEAGCGSCRECPKRSLANPDLFGTVDDGKGKDTCLDLNCYSTRKCNFIMRKVVATNLRVENRGVLVGRPDSRSLIEKLEKVKAVTISDHYWSKASKKVPGAVPMVTPAGKVMYVTIEGWYKDQLSDTQKKVINAYKGKTLAPAAGTTKTTGQAPSPQSEGPKTSLGDRMFKKICGAMQTMLIEQRESMWRIKMELLPNFHNQMEVSMWAFVFGMDHKLNFGQDPKTWARLDDTVLLSDINNRQFKLADFNIGNNLTVPASLCDEGKRPTLISYREAVYIHIMNIMHSRMGLGGGPAEDCLRACYQAQRIASWEGIDLSEDLRRVVDKMKWPKTWTSKHTDKLLDDLQELCLFYIKHHCTEGWSKAQTKITPAMKRIITHWKDRGDDYLPTWALPKKGAKS